MSPKPAYSENQLLTVKEAAPLLRLSQKTLYRMLSDGRLPAKRFGRAWRIDANDLRR